MRRSHLVTLMGVLLAVSPLATSAIGNGRTSEKLSFPLPESGEIRWVPESIAIRRGELQETEFSDWELREIESLIARSRGSEGKGEEIDSSSAARSLDCSSTSITFGTEGRELDIRNLFLESAIVLEGAIIEESAGLLNGSPATLFAFEVEFLHRNALAQGVRPRYFSYPVADLHLKGARICQRALVSPRGPKVGSRVAVFARSTAGEMSELLVVTEEDVLFETPNGRVGYSPAMKAIEPLDLSWPDLSRQLRELSSTSAPAVAN